jgi:hypothetical protein
MRIKPNPPEMFCYGKVSLIMVKRTISLHYLPVVVNLHWVYNFLLPGLICFSLKSPVDLPDKETFSGKRWVKMAKKLNLFKSRVEMLSHCSVK